jgi:hypothetical protein
VKLLGFIGQGGGIEMIGKELHALLKTRANGYCEYCGRDLGEEGDPHHRQLKSRGGKDRASNLILIHHACHMKIHANPSNAEKDGSMVSSWQDPLEAPYRLPSGFHALLRDNGEIKILDSQAELF